MLSAGQSHEPGPRLSRSLLVAFSLLSLLPVSKATAAPKTKTRPSNKEETSLPESADYARRFSSLLEQVRDLEYPGLLDKLRIRPARAATLSFDPSKARYYAEARRALGLAAGEEEMFRKYGFAMVDHGNKLSMGQAYLEIYRADLPVFVSADSILQALHKSYDEILRLLEEESLFSNLEIALAKIQTAICGMPRTAELRFAVADLDLTVAVARKLLEPGKAAGEQTAVPPPKSCGDEAAIAAIGKKIAALADDDPDGPGTPLWGRRSHVAWSQFRPRGHYTKTPRLQAYFQAMMWLGRADIAWKPKLDRELKDAALLVLLAAQAEQGERLAEMSRLIDFLVGRADSLGLEGMQAALKSAEINTRKDLDQPGALARLRQEVAKRPEAMQQIRSELVVSDRHTAQEVPLSVAFQLFGQRFVLDSFLLSKVVYDSVLFRGRKQERQMPLGLDVMAALGSDEAVIQLEPEIRKWNYAANLFAARRLIENLPDEQWRSNAYSRWLGALRILYHQPDGKYFPQVMRTAQWQRKELQTTSASWAELRHDTILYAKQSETAYAICEYPEGYVEPYPAFYSALAQLARQAMRQFAGPVLGTGITKDGKNANWGSATRVEAFFGKFAKTMDRLAAIAGKELSATPLDADEKLFLKQVIAQKVEVGCVATTIITGWYPQLIFSGDPLKREPTVADVHTDPNSGTVLEEGVGDIRYLLIAVDNDKDRAVYVGPTYSYYEFTSGTRLTDAEWESRISSTPAPAFIKEFVGGPVQRTMTVPAKKHE